MSEQNPKKRKAEDESPDPEVGFTVDSAMHNVRNSDKRLLETGEFSDVLVECGGTVWRLHKSILCTRSSYFAKALAGQFEEAITGKLVTREMNPEIVQCIIVISTNTNKKAVKRRALKTKALENFSVTLRYWCELFLAADYFQLEDLMKTILARQSDLLSDIAKHLQTDPNALEAVENKTPEKISALDFLDAFFDVVAFVYSHELDAIEPYKKSLCTFVRQIHYLVVVDARFKEHLRSTPQFGVDLFCEHVFDQPLGGLMPWSSLPKLCYTCGMELKTRGFDDIYVVQPPGSIRTYAEEEGIDDEEHIILVRANCMSCTRELRANAD
ncbi:hypothetical protein PG984_001300 [Apiospora sp. TS-2023a]